MYAQGAHQITLNFDIITSFALKQLLIIFSMTGDAFGLSWGSKGSVYRGLPYSNYPVGQCGHIPKIEVKMLLKCQNNEFHRS